MSAWRVVETHYDQLDRVTRSIPHTRIGSTPMSESDARAYATQETGRYAGARLRRTFRAEPVTPPRWGAAGPIVATCDGCGETSHWCTCNPVDRGVAS